MTWIQVDMRQRRDKSEELYFCDVGHVGMTSRSLHRDKIYDSSTMMSMSFKTAFQIILLQLFFKSRRTYNGGKGKGQVVPSLSCGDRKSSSTMG